jgi:hypothetical protein
MKRFGFLFVALVTFAAGVMLTRYSSALFQTAECAFEVRSSIPLRPQSSHSVQISLRRSFRDNDGVVIAEFNVVNRSAEPLIYLGYSKGDHEQWTIRRGNRSKRYSPFCATGLEERLLAPDESANFTVYLGSEGGDLQVGFDFLVGPARSKQTIWSNEFFVSDP